MLFVCTILVTTSLSCLCALWVVCCVSSKVEDVLVSLEMMCPTLFGQQSRMVICEQSWRAMMPEDFKYAKHSCHSCLERYPRLYCCALDLPECSPWQIRDRSPTDGTTSSTYLEYSLPLLQWYAEIITVKLLKLSLISIFISYHTACTPMPKFDYKYDSHCSEAYQAPSCASVATKWIQKVKGPLLESSFYQSCMVHIALRHMAFTYHLSLCDVLYGRGLSMIAPSRFTLCIGYRPCPPWPLRFRAWRLSVTWLCWIHSMSR